MNYVKGQYVRLPSITNFNFKRLRYTDTLVYIALRSFDNSTNGCFPSYESIAKRSGCSRTYVIKAIERLEKEQIIIVGRSPKIKVVNQYRFANGYRFEQIPYSIFDADLTINQKSMLLCLRESFIAGNLTCLYSISELAKLLGLSYKIVHSQMGSLIKKGYVTQGIGSRKNVRKFTNKIEWNFGYVGANVKKKIVCKLLVG